MSELSGRPATAATTFAFHLVLQVRKRGESTAWITSSSSSFFPPDAAEAGVDLDALIVVRVPSLTLALAAADLLLRSGGFGLVALDLGSSSRLGLAEQSRLAGLAGRHHSAVLL